MHYWQLREAKNRFGELIKMAVGSGPQIVKKRGVKTVVVISIDEYRKLTQPKLSLVDFFRQSPLSDTKIDLERIREYPREVNL